MNSKTLYFLLMVFGVLMVSCSKDDKDTTKPQILILEPVEEQVFHPGEAIHFGAEFLDNEELSSYKIDIHPNEDGHDHKSTKGEGEWSFQKSWQFEAGKRNANIHHEEILIPTEVDGVPIHTGDYHFLVYCTDKAGNESWVAVAIEIQNR
jgi:hypothetical protein